MAVQKKNVCPDCKKPMKPVKNMHEEGMECMACGNKAVKRKSRPAYKV